MTDSDGQSLSHEELITLVRQGSEVWNAWAKENQGRTVDFTNYDFTESGHEGISFKDFIFPGVVSFANAKFDNADFSNAIFSGDVSYFTDAKFLGKLTAFWNVVFDGNADFTNTTFSGGSTYFFDAKFNGPSVEFSNAIFSGGNVRFENAVFSGKWVRFDNVEFCGRNANFSNVKFTGGDVDFSNAKFEGGIIDFSGVEFSGGFVIFDGALFTSIGTTSFDKVIFSGGNAHFRSTNFSGTYTSFLSAEFSGGMGDFYGAKFGSSRTDFGSTSFIGGNTDFSWSVFDGGSVNFSWADFYGGDTLFDSARFSAGEVGFYGAEFSGGAVSFADAVFGYSLDLESTYFSEVPDFRRTKLTAHLTVQGVHVDFQSKSAGPHGVFSMAVDEFDADKYRRLKELAVLARDHEGEQEFFAKELKAKRFYGTTGMALVWSYLYEWCSDFGRSTYRPLALLTCTWFICGIGYFLAAGIIAGDPTKSLLDGFRLSAATLVPFVAVSKSAMTTAQKNLFGDHVPFGIDAVAFVEGILGLAFVFLIGLALRNRFRI